MKKHFGSTTARAVPLFVWNNPIWTAATRAGYKATRIGSPLLYLPSEERSTPPNELAKAKSRIAFFPSHALVRGQKADSIEHTIKLLGSEVPLEEVDIFLHYNEYFDPVFRSRLEDNGLSITTIWRSPDDLYQEEFLPRLVDALQSYRISICSVAASAFWYSAYLGLEARVLDIQSSEGRDYEYHRSLDLEADTRKYIFWPSKHYSPDEVRLEARRELGTEHVKEPEELSEILGYNSVSRRAIARGIETISLSRLKVMKRRGLPLTPLPK